MTKMEQTFTPQQPDELLLDILAEENPLVLLWGQDGSLSSETREYLFREISKHLGKADPIANWSDIVSGAALPNDFYTWMAERFSLCPAPAGIEAIASIPWSAVFTSSLDPSLIRILNNERREAHAILTGAEVPPAARSTARTPMYYLFGRAGASDSLSMPPTGRPSLRVRTNVHTIPMLNRLSETVTSLGLLVIDGLSSAGDWLNADLILPVLEQMSPSRILWCGFDLEAHSNQDLVHLVESGHIIVTPSRLATILARLAVSGRLKDLSSKSISDQASTVTVNSKGEGQVVFTIPPALRIRVETSATIVDDSWTSFNPPLGRETEYALFRRFHGDLEGARGMVEGTRRGFAIDRDFEKELWSAIADALKNHSRYADPIIVHGQSATGKSIALARAVAKLRTDHRVPVLYATTRLPSTVDIEAFCEAIDALSLVTAVVCDNNASIQRYRDLLFSLQSRGRRVILVCSSYRQIDLPSKPPKSLIEAPELLTQKEKEALDTLIHKFSDGNGPTKKPEDANMLLNLYYRLPATRSRLTSGIGREAKTAEELLRRRSLSARQTAKDISLLAERLLAAGFNSSEGPSIQAKDDPFASLDDDASRLISLVMVPGQVDCPVPIDILMRVMQTQSGPVDLDRIGALFGGLDLFRWRKGEHAEELLVGPRLALEAQLICRRRLMNPIAEGEFITQLIGACRLSWDAGGSERRFLLDLLQKVGPDGPLRERYGESYLSFARSLTRLRDTYGVFEPSLMLQESVLRREAVKRNAIGGVTSIEILEEARAAVQDALEYIDAEWRVPASRAKTNLLVERATIFGFLATQQLLLGASNEDIWSAYMAARVAAKTAVGATGTYFPLDVSLWIPQDLLESPDLTDSQRIELKADILSTLEQIDPSDYPYEQQERFNRRRFRLGEALGDPDLSEAAFIALAEQGGTAGYYLRARTIGPNLSPEAGPELNPDDYSRAESALKFLDKYWPHVENDERCLRFYLQCKWISSVRQRLFRQERGALPFGDKDRRKILSIVESINGLASLGSDNQMLYLQAVFSWLLGDEKGADETWGKLSSETEYLDPKRPFRRHILTGQNGQASIFSGRIESGADPYWLRVEDLGRRIRLLGRDFSNDSPSYGRQIPSFAIAFNYIGPIADPIIRKGA
jgi:hypothetical protein